ncbi:MAG: hypothetical protein QOK47_968 [Actinomycetota bacterium]|nr:hypothetical protein [Actinomycetota bacterium]
MRTLITAGTLVLALLGAACGDAAPTPKVDEPAAAESRAPLTIEDPYEPTIDPANFGGPIDNPYMPLEPGTTLVYEGLSDGEKELNTVEVTDKTKNILGIDCVVVLDKVFADGVLAEKTLDWYAQDVDGNVWYMGEYSKSYENGKFVDAHGSWEAGVDGALPGIAMPADPMVGDSYRQEYLKGEAEDTGEVLQTDATASVPYGSYENVLVTEDLNPNEPKVVEHKYYAPGVGFVREEMLKGGNDTVKLVDIR